jgi:inosine-uridine nucleoside N-ribohydrolase
VALQLLQFYGAVSASAGRSGPVLHDPLAVALAALPELATFVPLYLEVETAGAHARGASIGSFSPTASRVEWVDNHWDATGVVAREFNASVARDIDVPRFLDLFLDRLELV